MSNWYLIVLVGLAVAGFLLLRYRSTRAIRRQEARRDHSILSENYVQDREDARLAHMSTEDRAWETASLQRNQANQERRAALVE